MGFELLRCMVDWTGIVAAPAIAWLVAHGSGAFSPKEPVRAGLRPIVLALVGGLLAGVAGAADLSLLPGATGLMALALFLAHKEQWGPDRERDDLLQAIAEAKIAAERGEAPRTVSLLAGVLESARRQMGQGTPLPGALRRRP